MAHLPLEPRLIVLVPPVALVGLLDAGRGLIHEVHLHLVLGLLGEERLVLVELLLLVVLRAQLRLGQTF